MTTYRVVVPDLCSPACLDIIRLNYAEEIFVCQGSSARSIIPDYVGTYVIKKVRLEPNKLLA